MEEAMPAKAVIEPNKPRKLLVIDLVRGFAHTSIPYWNKALEIMGEKTGAFSVTISQDVNMFSSPCECKDEKLRKLFQDIWEG